MCKVSADSESHLMEWHILVNCVPELRNKYEDIFKSVDKQVKTIKLLTKVIEVRELLLL